MNLSKLILATASTITLNLAASAPVKTAEIDRELLCSKFPLNSRCQDYQIDKSESKTYQLDRNSFCDRCLDAVALCRKPTRPRCIASP